MRKLLIFASVMMLTAIVTGCINDDFDTSSSARLTFSTEKLEFDTVITAQGSPTKQFVVYNRGKKSINISEVYVAGESDGHFFLNVDGTKGEVIRNIEVRGNDSVYVFVESRLDPTGHDEPIFLEDKINFVVNGVTQSMPVTAWGQDVEILDKERITGDVTFSSGKPYVIYDSLVVEKGATLTLAPGTTLLMHDKARLSVHGTLHAYGSQKEPIVWRGDRLDHVVGRFSFDIMSGQWAGVEFLEESFGNVMSYVNMRGSTWGVTVENNNPDLLALLVRNCVLHNSAGNILATIGAWTVIEGSELSDCALSVLAIWGGKVGVRQCTLANYYLFSALSDPIISFHLDDYPDLNCVIDNTISYGNTKDVDKGDLTGYNVSLRHCLLKSNGVDDANFINCVWAGDPMFYTVREDYLFDYRIKPESDARARGNLSLCPDYLMVDMNGVQRNQNGGIDIGAYAFTIINTEN